jgi:hypothetical protein
MLGCAYHSEMKTARAGRATRMRNWRVLNSSVVSFWLKLQRSPPCQKRSAIVEELACGVFLSQYQAAIQRSRSAS